MSGLRNIPGSLQQEDGSDEERRVRGLMLWISYSLNHQEACLNVWVFACSDGSVENMMATFSFSCEYCWLLIKVQHIPITSLCPWIDIFSHLLNVGNIIRRIKIFKQDLKQHPSWKQTTSQSTNYVATKHFCRCTLHLQNRLSPVLYK